jgi:HK97 family phage prohead protease
MTDLETREFLIRDVDAEARTVSGLAVPYDTDTSIGGMYIERIARGAVQDSDDALLFWRHSEPIGKLTAARDTDAGWEISAKISQTPRGDEAYTLLKDGVIDRMSIGFEPQDDEFDSKANTITRTRIKVREVSLVPFPAYAGAKVSAVRSQTPDSAPAEPVTQRASGADLEDSAMTDDTITRADLDATAEDIERRFAVQLAGLTKSEPVADRRSAAEILKGIVAGDEATIKRYDEMLERAYAGGTTADSINLDAWIGDLSRIYDGSSGALANFFGTAPLPSEGLSVEYGVLSSNTVDVTAHTEGTDLTPGKVTLTTATAPVNEYAGLAQLTIKEIERSSVQILNKTLQALTIAAAKREKTVLRTAFAAAVTAQTTADNTVESAHTLAASTIIDWRNAVVDAAVKFSGYALPLEALLVSPDVFKALNALVDSAGRPQFDTTGTGSNATGTLALTGLTGDLSGLTVVLDADATGTSAVFANSGSITRYLSPLVQLTDQNVVNLSNSYAAYRFGAVANEVPEGIVPLTFAAS